MAPLAVQAIAANFCQNAQAAVFLNDLRTLHTTERDVEERHGCTFGLSLCRHTASLGQGTIFNRTGAL
jgi:hypothetical protein